MNGVMRMMMGSAKKSLDELSVFFHARYEDLVDRTTYTFSGCDFGEPASDRLVVVVIFARGLSFNSRTLSSVSIGGVTATLVGSTSATNRNVHIAYALVPTGTTGQVVATYSGTMRYCNIVVNSVRGYSDTSPVASGFSVEGGGSTSFSLSVPEGTVLVGADYFNSGYSGPSFSGSTATSGTNNFTTDGYFTSAAWLEGSVPNSGETAFTVIGENTPFGSFLAVSRDGSHLTDSYIAAAWG